MKPGDETLTLEPNPVAANSLYTISGTGYRPGELLQVRMLHSEQPWSFEQRNAVVGDDGAFSFVWGSYLPGTVEVETWRRRGHGPKMNLLAEATLEVLS